MSWGGYIHRVEASEAVWKCGIYGYDGSTWATNAGLNASPEEIKAILVGCRDNAEAFHEDGPLFCGEKLIFIGGTQHDGFKFKRTGNNEGVVVGLGNQACIVCYTAEGVDFATTIIAATVALMGVLQFMSESGF